MNNINTHFKKYCFFISQITIFLRNNFGEGDYLTMKNSGTIPSRKYGLKNQFITGYSFHGSGCGFQFKNFEVDIEFENNEVGFTHWSFYLFLRNQSCDVDENSVDFFLKGEVKKNKLECLGKIYKII